MNFDVSFYRSKNTLLVTFIECSPSLLSLFCMPCLSPNSWNVWHTHHFSSINFDSSELYMLTKKLSSKKVKKWRVTVRHSRIFISSFHTADCRIDTFWSKPFENWSWRSPVESPFKKSSVTPLNTWADEIQKSVPVFRGWPPP